VGAEVGGPGRQRAAPAALHGGPRACCPACRPRRAGAPRRTGRPQACGPRRSARRRGGGRVCLEVAERTCAGGHADARAGDQHGRRAQHRAEQQRQAAAAAPPARRRALAEPRQLGVARALAAAPAPGAAAQRCAIRAARMAAEPSRQRLRVVMLTGAAVGGRLLQGRARVRAAPHGLLHARRRLARLLGTERPESSRRLRRSGKGVQCRARLPRCLETAAAPALSRQQQQTPAC